MGFYIIEINDKYKQVVLLSADGELYCKDVAGLMPYTEPDIEQVRKEAYAEGRKVGIKDGKCEAWEAARYIDHMSDDDIKACFECGFSGVFEKYTASEAIEKIRQYEQEKEKKDSVWIASETWIVSGANEPSVDTTLICSKCGYAITIKPHETPALNFCPKCGDCKKPKEEES